MAAASSFYIIITIIILFLLPFLLSLKLLQLHRRTTCGALGALEVEYGGGFEFLHNNNYYYIIIITIITITKIITITQADDLRRARRARGRVWRRLRVFT